MSKVKVTQEQADWLDKYKSNEEIDYAINVQPHKKRPDSPIVDWAPSKVAYALYRGYEVEPEFKDDEWVLLTNGTITQILYVRDDAKSLYPSGKSFAHSRGGDCWYDYSFIKRHAAPEEIAEEKERRTDKKLNDFLCRLSSEEKDRLYEKLVSFI